MLRRRVLRKMDRVGPGTCVSTTVNSRSADENRIRKKRTTRRAVREVEINITSPMAVSGMPNGKGSANKRRPSTVSTSPTDFTSTVFKR